MEAQRFDRLVRAFNVHGTRRRVLRFLVAPPFLGALAALLEEREVRADGSGAGIGGNRNKHRNRKAHQHRRSHEPRREKRCQPKSKAKTCANKCGPIRNNCKKTVDCGVCPACHICDEESGECVPDPNEEGEPCGDGQVCQLDGSCECSEDSCGACRTCGGDGACQECSGCCDGAVCVEECGCGQECCDGLCCPSGEVCQDDACCARDCAAVACGSGAPQTCGVANCGTCPAGQTCIAGACVAVCAPGTCPQECNCLITPEGTPICLTAIGGTCTGLCRDDSDCCPGTSCVASPSACGGQFVCYVLGSPCAA